jgi:hypothetical protein
MSSKTAACRIPLEEWIRSCRSGKRLPQFLLLEETEWGKAISCALQLVGAAEPLTATRPDACTIKNIFDKTIVVPPATIDDDGKIVPRDGLLIKICAPMGQALVVDKLRVLPANLTAKEKGEVAFKKQAVFGFSDGFCNAGEPGPGSPRGTFQNYEHVVLCPQSGFDVWGRNYDPYSSASFDVHAEMWTAC